MEKILRIEQTTFKKDPKDYHNFNGFQVITDKQTIKLGIDDSQDCCEVTGYFWSNDKLEDFVGAKLLDIKIVDECLLKEKLKENFYEGGTMFVDFETSKGVLQFTAYNSHNGYYGHEAVVISNQLNKEESL